MSSEELTNRYSIGTNVVVESCTADLNKLLKIVTPIARDMPWKYWLEIIQSDSSLLTCFDDTNNTVVGMTTVVPIITPAGKFAEICDTAVLPEYDTNATAISLVVAANDLLKKAGLILR